MNRHRIPSLALAFVLQVVPVCRVVTTNPAIATPTFAIVARCAAAIAALLGAVDAVSGVWYPVTVSAGNLLFATVAMTNILITITNASGVSPPTITAQPQSCTVTNGGSASFSVVATGSPTYQWRKFGTNLSGATSAGFTIPAVTTNDAGNYSVVAANAGGAVTSAVATLTVLVPPGITTPPQNLTVTNGDTARFQVVATGLPLPAYQWRFNGAPLPGATAAGLVVNNAQPANEGDYAVEVSDAAGTVVSAPAHLTVWF